MSRRADRLLTALAPVTWGSTYLVTTELLPPGYPVTVALLRALPAGLLLLALVRRLPSGRWWLRTAVLGALNFTVFWMALFVAAYRLPGGVAATLGSVQPLLVVLLARIALGRPLRPLAVAAAVVGLVGVALLVLSPDARLDRVGVVAALVGAASMAGGTVLTRRWAPDLPLLTLTAWQLTAGGLLLLPLALILEPPLPELSAANLGGLAFLSLVGAALAYLLWFRGIARIGATQTTMLGFLSPLTALVLGWAVLGQALGPQQLLAAGLVLGSIWLGQARLPASSLSSHAARSTP